MTKYCRLKIIDDLNYTAVIHTGREREMCVRERWQRGEVRFRIHVQTPYVSGISHIRVSHIHVNKQYVQRNFSFVQVNNLFSSKVKKKIFSLRASHIHENSRPPNTPSHKQSEQIKEQAFMHSQNSLSESTAKRCAYI